jgi:hypothetical protein
VTRPDVSRVNVDLSDIQRWPRVRQMQHKVDDRTDRVLAAQIVVARGGASGMDASYGSG